MALADAGGMFQGGCHCGHIRYEVAFDSADLKGTRCNCTFCQKLSTTMLSVKDPLSEFRLLKPASKEDLNDYAPKTKTTEGGNGEGHRFFCGTCSVLCWIEGWYKFGNHRHEYFAVNLASIDQPQDRVDLSNVKISYLDGLHNKQSAGLQDKPWPCGLP